MRAIIQYTAMNGGTGGPQVEEIWALDAVAQGDSAILNDGFLGPMGKPSRSEACSCQAGD
jgi:hypothetical protein